MNPLKVLIACEKSGVVREAFAAMGHWAYSCDLLPTERAPFHNSHHYIDNIFDALSDTGFYADEQIIIPDQGVLFDIIIAHPDCTALCVSGNHVYAKGKPKYDERLAAAEWTQRLWDLCKLRAHRVVFENPVSVLPTFTDLPKPSYIQPHDFGHDASKNTALFLHELPPLKPTERIQGRWVNGRERWANQTDSGQNRLGPSADRWMERARTYTGIADAMATQWTAHILLNS